MKWIIIFMLIMTMNTLFVQAQKLPLGYYDETPNLKSLSDIEEISTTIPNVDSLIIAENILNLKGIMHPEFFGWEYNAFPPAALPRAAGEILGRYRVYITELFFQKLSY